MEIHQKAHVYHMSSFREQSSVIAKEKEFPALPYLDDDDKLAIGISKLSAHGRADRGYQFIALSRNLASHKSF